MRLSAAKDVLDRAGPKAPQRLHVGSGGKVTLIEKLYPGPSKTSLDKEPDV
jgi:hypothetical protein